MDAEKQALRRRIDKLDEYATRLHAALTEAERENAQLKAELETVKRERDAAVEKYNRMKENALILSEAVTAYDRQSHKKYNFSGLSAENGGVDE